MPCDDSSWPGCSTSPPAQTQLAGGRSDATFCSNGGQLSEAAVKTCSHSAPLHPFTLELVRYESFGRGQDLTGDAINKLHMNIPELATKMIEEDDSWYRLVIPPC